MTDFEGEQPRCPSDGIVMRDIDGGWVCPSCGFVFAPVVQEQQQPRFEGPSIHGG